MSLDAQTSQAAPLITTMFLRDTTHGGQSDQPQAVAAALARYIDGAGTSLDVAIYDFRLSATLASTVLGAFIEAAQRGVTVRIAYDEGKPANATAATFAALEADPAPAGNAEFLATAFKGTAVQLKPIDAAPQLMHSKYVIRDGEAVWTGSANFTDDAWTLQENNILTIASADVAAAYERDFAALWATGKITETGKQDSGTVEVDAAAVGYDFSPGDGVAIDNGLEALVNAASERIVIASMVLTSPTLLAALADAAKRGVPLAGIYDGGQMAPIVAAWRKSPHDTAKLADFTEVERHLTAKYSMPYAPAGPHNFMHNKVLVTDNIVTTGSYNFSKNAEKNAENQVHIASQQFADNYAAYIAELVQTYQR